MTVSTSFRPIHAVAILLVALVACRPDAAESDGATRPAPSLLRREQPAMGTWFSIQVFAPDDTATARAIDAAFAEIDAVEAAISEWRDTSDITRVNHAAGTGPVSVGEHMVAVARIGNEIAEATGGAFDMTFAACGGLWDFETRRVPAEQDVAACVSNVDWRAVSVNVHDSTVALRDGATRIGVGGVGKGYGVDRAAAVLEAAGILDYVVDGGGDLRVRGTHDGRPWTVAIADPRRPDASLGRIEITEGSIVTSGDYERFFELDGVRFHHILDPRTGMPADRSIAVTVIAPDATRADALATGLFVLGPEAGIPLAESMPGVEALIVGPDESLHMTAGFSTRMSIDED